MKKKRNVFYILLTAALACFLLDACGRESQNPDTVQDETQTAGKQKIICYDVTVSKPYMEDQRFQCTQQYYGSGNALCG